MAKLSRDVIKDLLVAFPDHSHFFGYLYFSADYVETLAKELNRPYNKQRNSIEETVGFISYYIDGGCGIPQKLVISIEKGLIFVLKTLYFSMAKKDLEDLRKGQLCDKIIIFISCLYKNEWPEIYIKEDNGEAKPLVLREKL